MKRFAVLLLTFIIFPLLSAQVNRYGTPVMKSYPMKVTQGSEYNWCIAKDKFGIVYFGNDNNLVIKFDGSKWSTIPLNPNNEAFVRTIAADKDGVVYLAGASELGYIAPDSTGKQVYTTLVDKVKTGREITSSVGGPDEQQPSAQEFTIGEIKSLVISDSLVYFLSAGSLIIYDKKLDSISYVNLRKLGYRKFERMIDIDGRLILGNNVTGLFEFKGGKIVRLPGGEYFSRKMCLVFLPYTKDEIIIGTAANGIFRYNFATGTVDSSFIDRKLSDKFKHGIYIYNGLQLYSGEYVFGTTTDGLYVFDKSGKYVGHWTTENTNLLDNSIASVFVDPGVNSEMWICTTGSITKAYVNMPFTEISNKTGIDGSINSFCKFSGSIFVATDKGLFRSKVNDDGSEGFEQFGKISSEVFPLVSATVKRDSFLLVGSTFAGVCIVDPKGNISSIKGDRVINSNSTIKLGFAARTIVQSAFRENRFYFGKSSQGISVFDYVGGYWKYIKNISGSDGIITGICELKNGDIIFLYKWPDGLFRCSFDSTQQVRYTGEKGLPDANLTWLDKVGDDVILSTSVGLYRFNESSDSWEPYDKITGGFSKGRYIDAFFGTPGENLWVTTKAERYNETFFEKQKDSVIMHVGGSLSVLPDQSFVFNKCIDGRTWMQKSKSIFVVDEARISQAVPEGQTLFTRILKAARGTSSLVMTDFFVKDEGNNKRVPVKSNPSVKAPEFSYKYNSLSFHWTTPYMIEEEDIQYSYMLQGFENIWSKWDKVSYKDYTNLPFGKYTFRVKGKTITGAETAEASYSFVVLKPWYVTSWMILLYIVATIFAVAGIIAAYTRRLKNENIRLEGIVAERTAVVVKQKEELESSIHYASRIQMALLPSQKILSENVKNYFILFKPRDIVSGDFYWMTKKGERPYVVAADCTGHGVPGAFMSLLGMSFLDEIIGKQEAPRADYILNKLRLHVTDSLKQLGGDDEAKDGMDLALLVMDFGSNRVEFSGAYNPCFKVRKLTEGEAREHGDTTAEKPDGTMSDGKYLLETIYASKMPIGISSRMDENFIFFDWALEKGVSYYMFSDGYIDQFGGPKGRKFLKKNFKKLILEIQNFPMNRQKEILEQRLKEWMGQSPQIDDILVMGIKTE